MNEPTQKQMAVVAKIAQRLLAKHSITTAYSSQTNPYLLALIIPMSAGEAKVVRFANELFHELKVLPMTMRMKVSEANRYCALDVDTKNGGYLVIFNHPAIFDYPEDSLEGRCAYGEWKTVIG